MTDQVTYRFHEPFRAFDEKNIPYGLQVERNSVYTHLHARVENGVFYITCGGNNFLFNTPPLGRFEAVLACGFHLAEGNKSFRFLFGYDTARRNGWALNLLFREEGLSVSLVRIVCGAAAELRRRDAVCTVDPEDLTLCVSVSGNRVKASLGESSFAFELPEDAGTGLPGLALTSSVGEMAVRDISLTSPDPMEHAVLAEERSAELSLLSGGSMPYRLSWTVESWNGKPYLRYRLDGGIQYRDSLPGWPRRTGQYVAERHSFRDPWIALYEKGSSAPVRRYSVFSGSFTVSDPGLVWHVLLGYFGVLRLPLEASVPLPEGINPMRTEISFGYEERSAIGYRMQAAKGIEEVFDLSSGARISEGKARGIEHIAVRSESEAALSAVPHDVYDREAVERHLAGNHFFAEGETVRFAVRFVSARQAEYLSMEAALQDVYGDPAGLFDGGKTEEGWSFAHEALPTGVYRAVFTALYGDTEILKREIVFEVFDPSGRKCAPLESGLPVLFSMPNEQKYLDRDAFDLYNPAPDCNTEHFYSLSALPGDVGIRRRVWETNRVFGRKWYVWDSFHRTLTRDEFREYGEELVRRSDYCYYPVPHEWAVMRHDPLSTMGFPRGGDDPSGLYGGGILEYLRDFLKEHPGIDIGLAEDAKTVTKDQLAKLLSLCLNEWLDYANGRINRDFRANTAWLRSVNPDIRRACYGPFALYGGTLTTHHACRYIGFAPEGSLAEYMFDGFAQLEDYPYSCTYHTYQGAFFVAHALLHNPGLRIYPEEYTASAGGCIDGAVKDAHPPLGKYGMRPDFNVTHSYEYVYNTAHLTPEGFRYWDERGFMQRDFTEEFADAFVRGWKNVRDHEPAAPLRCAAYLSEIPKGEDRWKVTPDCSWVSNRSNIGLSYIFETSRLCGLPNGFPVTYSSLSLLTPDMTDCVVLPSLEDAPEEALGKIRSLYDAGVSLVAVGTVKGLEDLFGVAEERRKTEILSLAADDGSREGICPSEAEFFYRPDGGETMLWAEDGEGKRYPALVRTERTLLLNASADELGRQSYGQRNEIYYAANISALLRRKVSEAMRGIVSPVASSDGCGITLFRDRNGDTLLLAVDYSDYDEPESVREYTVSFGLKGIRDIEPLNGKKPILLRKGGIVRAVCLKLRQQECALVKLIRG